MLKRITSAVVAIAIGIVLIYLADKFTGVINGIIAIFNVFALYELYKAVNAARFGASYLCYIYGAISPFLTMNWAQKVSGLIVVNLFILVFCTLLAEHERLDFRKFSMILAGALLLPYSLNCLIEIHKYGGKHGVFALVTLLLSAWIADAGAYFAGTFFGKNKLCEKISPKKTYEGLFGGIVLNAIVLCLAFFVYNKWVLDLKFNYFIVIILGVLCSLIGLLGDLVFSVIKRQYKIKDYGKIMPGHGGFLDRFDSVIFIAPFFLTFINTTKLF